MSNNVLFVLNIKRQSALGFAFDCQYVDGIALRIGNEIAKNLSGNVDEWYTPAVVEQYYWAIPVDTSDSTVMKSFIQMYKFKKDPILL